MSTKQIIVMRTDLNMRKGKMCAQASHASMAFITRRIGKYRDALDPSEYCLNLSEIEREWLGNSFTKICVGVDSEDALLDIHQTALDAGIGSYLIQDNGTTEFGGVPTYTCLALGPAFVENLDPITGHLKLL